MIWDEYMKVYVYHHPIMATTFAYHNYDDISGDPFSQKTRETMRNVHETFLKRTKQLMGKSPSTELRVFCEFLQNRIKCRELDDATMIDHRGGWIVQTLIPALLKDQKYSTDFDQTRAEMRLEELPLTLESYTRCILLMGQRHPPSSIVLDAMIQKLEHSVNTLRTQRPDDVSNDLFDKMCSILSTHIQTSLIPNLKKLTPRSGLGVCYLKDGRRMYEAAMVLHCGIDNLSASEVHNVGKQKVLELTSRIEQHGPFDKTVKRGKEAIEMYKQIVKRSQEESFPKHLFPFLSQTDPCEVEEMPEKHRKGGPLAYYQGNCFWVNTNYDHPEHQAEALAFHEAVPGHHFQNNIEEQFVNWPAYRYFCRHTGFVEGWAMLAEHMIEPILPNGQVGILESERFRAVRLVVDTGIHALYWSIEKARQYMKEYASITPEELEAEIVRYTSEPGQALGYYSGLETFRTVFTKHKNNLPSTLEGILQDGTVPMKMVVRKWMM